MEHRSTIQLSFMILNASLGAFFVGYSTSYFNMAQKTSAPIFFNYLGNFNSLNTYLNVIIPIAGGIGSFASGPLQSFFSLRQSMMITDFIGILGYALQELGNVETFFIARALIGFAVGLNSTLVPSYINQFSPIYLSGSFGAINQILINTGALLGLSTGFFFTQINLDDPNVVALTTDQQFNSRIVFGLAAITCVIRILFLIFLYRWEPPQYYLANNQNLEANKVLLKIYKQKYIKDVTQQLTAKINNQRIQSDTYIEYFRNPQLRFKVIVASLLSILQQVSGINAIIFYSTTIFSNILNSNKQNQNNDLSNIAIYNLYVGITNFTFSLFAIWALKYVGRRPALLYGTILCAIILILTGVSMYESHQDSREFYDLSTLGCIFLFLMVFQLSLGPVVWIYISDTLQNKGISIAVLMNWASNTLVTLLFGYFTAKEDDYNKDHKDTPSYTVQYTSFFIFGTFCIIGSVFIFFYVKETKNGLISDSDQQQQLSLIQNNDIKTSQEVAEK